MKRQIKITTRFPALHKWTDCPIDEVRFLRYLHRHVFHVTLIFSVGHNDREIEFIHLKNQIEQDIQDKWYNKNLGTRSCEDIAEEFIEAYDCDSCEVLEDGENGAILTK